jgi:hypothetical protein
MRRVSLKSKPALTLVLHIVEKRRLKRTNEATSKEVVETLESLTEKEQMLVRKLNDIEGSLALTAQQGRLDTDERFIDFECTLMFRFIVIGLIFSQHDQ